jgi:urease accessory protein
MKIITHNGPFHTDEVMASAMLQTLFNIESITRTRDDKLIKTGTLDIDTFVIDVGKTYNHDDKCYDHHQSSFNDSYSKYTKTPLSSCGLIWKHYGEQLVEKFLSELFDKATLDRRIDASKLADIFYRKYVQCIDANDNGVKQIENPSKIKYNYYHEIKLFSIIGEFNSENTRNSELQMKQFDLAVAFCKTMFSNSMKKTLSSTVNYFKYMDTFTSSLNNAKKDNKQYMYLDSRFNTTPYTGNFDPDKQMKFIIVKNSDTEYKVYTRRKRPDSYALVMALASQESAREILKSNDIPENECRFIHKNQFMGAFTSLRAAELIVKETLALENNKKTTNRIYLGIGSVVFAGLCSGVAYGLTRFLKKP